jgi:hypothetical protein
MRSGTHHIRSGKCLTLPPSLVHDGRRGFDARPVRAFLPGPDLRVDESAWPASVPAMAHVLPEGLELPAGLTVLVGDA